MKPFPSQKYLCSLSGSLIFVIKFLNWKPECYLRIGVKTNQGRTCFLVSKEIWLQRGYAAHRPAFDNKGLLAHIQLLYMLFIHIHLLYMLFLRLLCHSSRVEQLEETVSQTLKCFLSGPLWRKFANPTLRSFRVN